MNVPREAVVHSSKCRAQLWVKNFSNLSCSGTCVVPSPVLSGIVAADLSWLRGAPSFWTKSTRLRQHCKLACSGFCKKAPLNQWVRRRLERVMCGCWPPAMRICTSWSHGVGSVRICCGVWRWLKSTSRVCRRGWRISLCWRTICASAMRTVSPDALMASTLRPWRCCCLTPGLEMFVSWSMPSHVRWR